METFEKIAEKGNPIFHIDLDPQENIKNKAYSDNNSKTCDAWKKEHDLRYYNVKS